jgi:hypothetical protein
MNPGGRRISISGLELNELAFAHGQPQN